MNKYICQEDARKAACELCDWYGLCGDKCHGNPIDKVPTANVVEQPRWIPVQDKLPDVGERVICYSKIYGVNEAIARQGRYYMLFLDPQEEYFEFKHVTHWMEMPAPPKEV